MSYAEKRAGKLTGVWLAERVLLGKRERIRCATKTAADRWEAFVDATGRAPMDGTGSTLRHSVGAVAHSARREREGWKASRDASLDQRIAEVVKFFGPMSALETITKARLYDLVVSLEARNGRDGGTLSPKTINRYLAVVSALLDYARECGLTNNTVSIPWQEETEGRIEFLTRSEELQVSALLPSEVDRLCLRLLTATGMRAGEFFQLTAQQVDISDNRCCWIRLWGDGTKNSKGRSIPVHSFEDARALKALITRKELPTHAKFYGALKAACGALGLSSKLSVHSLRHTFGTRLAVKVKPALIQTLMGHGSYKTTQRYIHLTDDDLMTATAALGV